MSATILYVLNAKSVTHFEEFGNGWGTGPLAWDYLSIKYFGTGLWESGDPGRLIDDLERDARLEGDERLVLLFLHCRAFVPLAYLSVAASACETFGARMPRATRRTTGTE